MQVNTDRLELRVMELEDTVALLSKIAATMNDMLRNLNEVGKAHTGLLRTFLERLEALDGANDDDAPPWNAYKG